jgi:hypothetical protein
MSGSATPILGTPTLRVPSPARTPSPLPLFSSGGGPYTYTGQITRKYASRFNEIDKTKNNVKIAGGEWEKEAKEKGAAVEDMMKKREADYDWENHYRVEEASVHQEDNKKTDALLITHADTIQDKRPSFEEQEFVDALQSPVEKPKDWNALRSSNDI